eukprot:GFUD01001081.1.p1 GENE.GFUD01001081.1~~GFUD01001081.1.p1  ORF type:complete len:205 (+),score=81.77 GFUD01001081.1:107-721(+)
MACITVGLDTSRVYNKKQPPGGACADLFGDHPEPAGDDKTQHKIPPSPAVSEPVLSARKSQPSPSVCPVTGETIGHSLPTPQAGTKTETANTAPEPAKLGAERKQEKLTNCKKEGETQPVKEKKDINDDRNDVPNEKSAVSATDSGVSQASTTTPSISGTPVSSSTPSGVKTSSSPAEVSVISSGPAPVKTRRVPPGGHTSALW